MKRRGAKFPPLAQIPPKAWTDPTIREALRRMFSDDPDDGLEPAPVQPRRGPGGLSGGAAVVPSEAETRRG